MVRRKKKKETKHQIGLVNYHYWISPRERQEKIAKLAHELFVGRGQKHGYSFKDWLEAEKIINSKHSVRKEN